MVIPSPGQEDGDLVTDHLQFIWQNLPNLLIGFPQQRPGGLLLSLWLAIVSVGLGFLIAAVVGSGRASRHRLWRWPALLYINVFRGLPLILLLLLVHQGLGGRRFGLDLTPFQSALIALTLYTSAYQAEIVRAGLQAVPQSVVDSAKLVGGSSWRIFWQIKIKYTLNVMLPAFVGQAISLFKDTSVVIVLGVGELLTVARTALGTNVNNTSYWVSLFLAVGLFYLGVALIASAIARRWERKRTNTDLVYSLANS
jgi:polar amino acid transport system permease protein